MINEMGSNILYINVNYHIYDVWWGLYIYPGLKCWKFMAVFYVWIKYPS